MAKGKGRSGAKAIYLLLTTRAILVQKNRKIAIHLGTGITYPVLHDAANCCSHDRMWVSALHSSLLLWLPGGTDSTHLQQYVARKKAVPGCNSYLGVS